MKKINFTLSLGAMLLTGAAIGIVSQRIPETKTYTDDIIQTIESSDLFKNLMANLGYQDEKTYVTESYPSSEPYSPETPKPGHPISTFIIHKPEYSLAYDATHRNPAWVYERLTADKVKDGPEYLYFSFKEDDTIPKHLRATVADYKNRGLAPGQMASASNYLDPEARSDTYYLTNVCPQCPQFNEGYWSKLDQHARDLTKNYQNVYAVSGPLYLPYEERGGRFVKYRVVGPNDVAVPSHFFKVLILENKEGKKEMLAYILPNYEIPLDTPLDHFKTTVQNVEKSAGIAFQ